MKVSAKIFGNYDQAGLDKEYDNRAKVAQSTEKAFASAPNAA
jgi:hypothetical protein